MATKYLDYDGLIYYHSKVTGLLDKKVDKETGKGLSSNDYTDSDKNKLAGIAAGAEVNVQSDWSSTSGDSFIKNKPTKLSDFTNDGDGTSGSSFATKSYVDDNGGKIDSIKVNGVAQSIVDKVVDIYVPVKVSDLTNDSNFVADANYVHTDNNYTTADMEKLAGIPANAQKNVQSDWNATSGDAFIKNKPTIPKNNNQLVNGAGYQTASDVQSAVNNAIKDITSFDYQVVSSLPATGSKGVIYLVPNSGSGSNTYDEYVWITVDKSSRFEKIGTTDVDLSGYLKTSDIVAITNGEIDGIVG